MQLASLIGHTQEVLQLIRSSDKPADSIIESFFRKRKYLGSHDRRFIAETSYGTLRHLRWCDTVVKKNVTLDSSLSPNDAFLLLVLTYLLGIEKRRDISSGMLGKNFSNSLSLKRIDEFMNAIRQEDEESMDVGLGARYSFQDWMVQKFVDKFGESEAGELCKKLNEQAPITLRANTLKVTAEECAESLRKEGIETEAVPGVPNALHLKKRVNVFALKSFKDGLFELQDAGSQVIPLLVDPKPTAKVLDACAGAGGKTLEFASLMKNRGEIVAADINKYRVEELKKRARRAGAFNIRPKYLNSLDDLADDYSEYFDIVFVDAPCTGVGTIRRNPGTKWSVTEEMVKELSEKQQTILKECAGLVKKGGRLVYATCSLFDSENEQVVENFLNDKDQFSRKNFVNPLDGSSSDFSYLLPHKHGTDGFFVSVLERSAN